MAFGGGLNSSSGGELKLYLKWKRNTKFHEMNNKNINQNDGGELFY